MRSDGADLIPIWNWYRSVQFPERLYRAMHMTKTFDYTNPAATGKGYAGEWLVEYRDGSWPRAVSDADFQASFVVCPNPRPESVMQPESLGSPNQNGAPKKEST